MSDYDKSKWKLPEQRYSTCVRGMIEPRRTLTLSFSMPTKWRILRLTSSPEKSEGLVLAGVSIGRIEWAVPDGAPPALSAFARATCCECGVRGAEHLFGRTWPEIWPEQTVTFHVENLTDQAREAEISIEIEDLCPSALFDQ